MRFIIVSAFLLSACATTPQIIGMEETGHCAPGYTPAYVPGHTTPICTPEETAEYLHCLTAANSGADEKPTEPQRIAIEACVERYRAQTAGWQQVQAVTRARVLRQVAPTSTVEAVAPAPAAKPAAESADGGWKL